MKKKITITNEFHHAETYVWAYDVDEDNNDLLKGRYQISNRQYESMWDRLCGGSDCGCGIVCTDTDGNIYDFDLVPAMNVIGHQAGNCEFTPKDPPTTYCKKCLKIIAVLPTQKYTYDDPNGVCHECNMLHNQPIAKAEGTDTTRQDKMCIRLGDGQHVCSDCMSAEYPDMDNPETGWVLAFCDYC